MASRTADRILDLLKTGGPQSAAALARSLGVTAVAIRQHLARLGEDGLVSGASDPPQGVGRPKQIWQLSETGHARYPDRHADLSADLIGAMQSAFGAEGMEKLLAERTARQLAAYRDRMPGDDAPLAEQVDALAKIRSDEGYMAYSEVADDGALLLVEQHCPICTAAKLCSGLCAQELELFERLLPAGTTIERTEHVLSDGRRCVYRIAAAA